MARKRHGRASGARTGKGQAREGHDRMSKKDMTETDKVGQVSIYLLAQKLVIKLSHQVLSEHHYDMLVK